MLEGPSSRLFNKTITPHTPQMAIFDSSTLAAGRLDQRKETKTSRLGLRLYRSCDPAVEDEELGEEGRLRTPGARKPGPCGLMERRARERKAAPIHAGWR